MTKAHKAGIYFNFPSWVNPHISRDWLRREKAALIARGEWDVWEREYGAKRVKGGSNAIFPMFDAPGPKRKHTRHVRPHAELMAEIERDRLRLEWQQGADPGNASIFAGLLRAINPFTRKVYVLDEIYEGNLAQTSTSRIVPVFREKALDIFPTWEANGVDWAKIYDEAATWFMTEALNSFDDHWTPTHKALNDKEQGLSLIKDQFLYDLLVFSDRCVNAIKEHAGYMRDKNGKIPKGKDHTVDLNRYLNAAALCDLTPIAEPIPPDPDTLRRGYSIEEDLLADADGFELEY